MRKVLLILVVVILVISVGVIGYGVVTWLGLDKPKVPQTAVKTISITDTSGENIQAGNFEATVVTWRPDPAQLKVRLKTSAQVYTLDLSPQAVVIIPPAGVARSMTGMGTAPGAESWPKAFCVGDTVSIAIDSNQRIVFANNTGARMCGLGEK
jgi:hypothetical protein